MSAVTARLSVRGWNLCTGYRFAGISGAMAVAVRRRFIGTSTLIVKY